MTNIAKKPIRESRRFIKFAIVGAIGTVIDFGFLNLLTIIFGVPKIYAQAISFSLAVVNNYLLNRYWTYPESRKKPFWLQFGQFTIISLIGLIIRTPLFAGLSYLFTLAATKVIPTGNTLKPEWIGNNLSLAICIVVVLLWNYFANRFWTFKDIK